MSKFTTNQSTSGTQVHLWSENPRVYTVGCELDDVRPHHARDLALVTRLSEEHTAFPDARLSHGTAGLVFARPSFIWRPERYFNLVRLVVHAYALGFDAPEDPKRAFQFDQSSRRLSWTFNAPPHVAQLERLIEQVPGVRSAKSYIGEKSEQGYVGGGIKVLLRATWRRKTSAEAIVRAIMIAYISGTGDGSWD